MDNVEIALALLKIITVGLGGIFLLITWRAFRRTGNRSILILFTAVFLMTAAAVAEGLAYQALGFSLDEAHIIEAAFTLLAFAVLVYSVWGYRVRREVRAPPSPSEPPPAE